MMYTRAVIRKLRYFLRTGKGDIKTQRMAKKLKLKNNILFLNTKAIVPEESKSSTLKTLLKNGMPVKSITDTWAWVQKRFVNFKRREISPFVKQQKQLTKQRMKLQKKAAVGLNRYKFTAKFYNEVLDELASKKSTNRAQQFVNRFPSLVLKGNYFMFFGKVVVPENLVTMFLEEEITKRGAPMTSRDALFKYMEKKYYGVSKRECDKFLKSSEYYQMSKVRPYKNTRVNPDFKEGRSHIKRQGKYNVGLDLFFVPSKGAYRWSGRYKYIYVAVHQYSGRLFAYPMTSKKSTNALRQLKKFITDFRKVFQRLPSHITSDNGTEFHSEHYKYITNTLKIPFTFTNKATFVEKKIQSLARNIGILKDQFDYPFLKSVELAIEKTNNVYSRKIKKMISEVGTAEMRKGLSHHHNKLPEVPKKKEQPTFKVGTKVRALTKFSTDVNQKFYKSYLSGKNKNTSIWSAQVYTITSVRKLRRYPRYLLSNNKEYWSWELQPIHYGVRKLTVKHKPEARQKPKKTKPPKIQKQKQSSEVSESNILTGKRRRKSRFSTLKF